MSETLKLIERDRATLSSALLILPLQQQQQQQREEDKKQPYFVVVESNNTDEDDMNNNDNNGLTMDPLSDTIGWMKEAQKRFIQKKKRKKATSSSSSSNNNNNNTILDQFNLSEYVSRIRVHTDKHSASKTVVLFGEIHIDRYRQRSVAIKFNIGDTSISENGLRVERQVMRNIVSSLIRNRNTPCLVAHIADIECKQLAFHSKQIVDEITAYTRRFDKPTSYIIGVLITEKPQDGPHPTLSLSSYLRQNELSEKQILDIMMLIFYTIHVMHQKGLRHNDLHMGNILVHFLPQPIRIPLRISRDEIVYVTTSCIPKIFDWDRSSIYAPTVERNMDLDLYFCHSALQCNHPTNSSDPLMSNIEYFMFTNYLRKYFRRPEFRHRRLYRFLMDDLFVKLKNATASRTNAFMHRLETRQRFHGAGWIAKMKPYSSQLVFPTFLEIVSKMKEKFNGHFEKNDDNIQEVKEYSIPEQVKYQLANPRREHLSIPLNMYNMITSDEIIHKVKIDEGDFNNLWDSLVPDEDNDEDDEIKHIMLEWRYEFELLAKEDSWSSIAFNLYQHPLLDNYRDSNHLLATACILLSCPFIYGTPSISVSDLFLSLVFDDDDDENDDGNTIFRYMERIWYQFNGELPILIPMLYKEPNHVTRSSKKKTRVV